MQYNVAVCYNNLEIYVRYFDCSYLGLWFTFFDAVKRKRFIIIRSVLAHPHEQLECPLGTLVRAVQWGGKTVKPYRGHVLQKGPKLDNLACLRFPRSPELLNFKFDEQKSRQQ